MTPHRFVLPKVTEIPMACGRPQAPPLAAPSRLSPYRQHVPASQSARRPVIAGRPS
jgi:hypothetical protein